MWQKRSIAGEIVDITPYKHGMKRGFEIHEWLRKNLCDSYVIIDDDDDMTQSQMLNFVKTSGNKSHPDCEDIGYGLTSICADKAIAILNKTDTFLTHLKSDADAVV